MSALVFLLAQGEQVSPWSAVLFTVLPALIVVTMVIFLASRYRRCPTNKVLVVYGKIDDVRTAKCLHGGGTLVWPIIQDCAYLSLEPYTIDVDLVNGLTREDEHANVSATFTVAISTTPQILQNAAERLLDLTEEKIETTARAILLGQMRLVVATLSSEEIETDRSRLRELVATNADVELNKIGLSVMHVDIHAVQTTSKGQVQ